MPGRTRSIRTPSALFPIYSKGLKRQRIIVPQTPERPIGVTPSSLLRGELMRPPQAWFRLHKRPRLGWADRTDPLEARAVSKSQVRGTLPERIMYLALIKIARLSPGGDFDFQSSLDGGRLELGGMVADFLLERWKLIIQVQGPMHEQYMNKIKDDEVTMTLMEMGYEVLFADQNLIFDEFALEEWVRKTFGMRLGGSSRGGAFGYVNLAEDEITSDLDAFMDMIEMAKQVQQGVTIYGAIQGAW